MSKPRCPRCEGSGRYQRLGFPEKECSLCYGTGSVWVEEDFRQACQDVLNFDPDLNDMSSAQNSEFRRFMSQAQALANVWLQEHEECEHRWTGQQLGGDPADAISAEWVEYCELCGMEKPGSDVLTGC